MGEKIGVSAGFLEHCKGFLREVEERANVAVESDESDDDDGELLVTVLIFNLYAQNNTMTILPSTE